MKGWRAETLAAWWLRLKGYRILARRHATPVGEIDLIARRGRCLAFVEVKARPDSATARHAIAPRQRRRIARAAEAYLQRRPELHGHDLRFDAVLVVPGRWPQHLPNAF
ncbi:putative endonuclease [Limimonas halophila]|uniref:UPF0102 protein SAMN05216241_10873 n=1 Tax=Limimonas halophila TaxID=1082479 RepID=A0A1G7T3E4_9PROT|nr:YraN family protein [Limimonas halophila]SDG29846.1 putative endonuclease [Limimonas halophila]